MSKDEINNLDLISYNGDIHLIEDNYNLDIIFNEIAGHNIVGFDTETKPSFKKGDKNFVSLVQIAIPERVFLLRIHKIGLAKEIIDFFENDKILKIGVAIKNDARELQQIRAFQPKGFLELPDFAEQLGIEAKGLRGLAAIILKGRVSKGAKITNWEADVLSEKQKIYAATDAWACLEMYHRIKKKRYDLIRF